MGPGLCGAATAEMPRAAGILVPGADSPGKRIHHAPARVSARGYRLSPIPSDRRRIILGSGHDTRPGVPPARVEHRGIGACSRPRNRRIAGESGGTRDPRCEAAKVFQGGFEARLITALPGHVAWKRPGGRPRGGRVGRGARVRCQRRGRVDPVPGWPDPGWSPTPGRPLGERAPRPRAPAPKPDVIPAAVLDRPGR